MRVDGTASGGISDEELIEQYYACDPEPLGELFLRYKDRLLRFLSSRFGASGLSREDIEDVVIHAFVRVMNTKYSGSRYTPKHDKSAAFRTWLYTIAIRIALSMLARRGHEIRFDDLLAPDDDPNREAGDAMQQLRDSSEPEPEALAMAAESLQQLRHCINRLPARERLAIELWLALHGATSQEIADGLSEIYNTPCSVATAWRIVQNALHLLRHCYEKEE